MCPFAMVMDGGRCFISSNFRFDHVEKWPLLMAWRRVLQIGINIMAWYQCDNSGLILAGRVLSAAGHRGLGWWPGILVRLS